VSLDAISAVSGVSATNYLTATTRTAETAGVGGAAFGTSLAQAVDSTQALQGESKTLAVQAVTGDLTDIQDATIAATRAQVSLELVAAIRNKGIDAFNEIMKMQA
jgi:flagellar hook-basal body complex protein FliE